MCDMEDILEGRFRQQFELVADLLFLFDLKTRISQSRSSLVTNH